MLATRLGADGRHYGDLYVDGGPSSTITVGHLRMNGREVFRHAVTELADAAEQVLAACGLTVADLDLERMLDRFDRPWPDTLGARVLEAIDSATVTDASATSWGSQLARLVRTAGPGISATLFDRALALASRDSVRAIPTRVTLDFDVFAQQIRLRQRLYQEIAR